MMKYFLMALLCSGCAGVGTVDTISYEINMVYSPVVLSGAKIIIQKNKNNIKTTGRSKVIRSPQLYEQLLSISNTRCKSQNTGENMAAMITSENLQIYVMSDKRFEIENAGCSLSFSEANNLVNQLGLKFNYYTESHDKPF